MHAIDADPATIDEDLARVDRETADLLRSVTEMTVGDLAEPSRCSGWTRAHVIGHVARNADSLVNLVTWASTGVETPQYPSAQAHDADIERSARQPLAQLQQDLADSARRCRDAFDALRGELRSPRIRLRNGREISAYELPVRRVNELVIHHFDLRTKWTLDDAAPRSLLGALLDSVQRMSAHPDAPAMVLRSDDGDDYAVGDPPDGSTTVVVRGSRAGMVAWLTRGVATNVRAEAPLPTLPTWG